jgi:lysozyme
MKRFSLSHGLWAIVLPALGACAAPVAGDDPAARRDDALTGTCPAGATVKGVDTSQWQGPIHWPAVKQSGQAFAIARVSDGLDYPDTQFSTDWPAIKAAGLVRGVYQFFRPSQDPVAQADLLASKLAQYGALGPGDLPPIMDIETTDGVAASVVVQRMHTWLAQVQALTGRTPMIYTAAFMSSTIGTSFSTYPLWVANYGVTCPSLPAGWNAWVLWQSGDAGSVPGISGGVDVDEFDGTLAQLLAFANGGGIPGGGGPSWSCASSAYAGSQYWTCSGGDLFECQGGAPVERACAMGCVARAAGEDDLCISPAPGWSCASSAYAGSQYWTCSGGDLYRCANGTPETIACPSGCTGEGLGHDDICN